MEKLSAKDKLRQKIAIEKNNYALEDLLLKSEEVFSVLEITGVFQSAKNVFVYNSLKDEVSTKSFIDRWSGEKNLYLPVVTDKGLQFRLYTANTEYNISSLGIYEPKGDNFTDYQKVDLVIVPGVAFDRKMNRMGRGKGYYDRFLPKLSKATKIGVCFDFQLLESIPSDSNDVKMDMLVSENDLIW